MAASLLQMADAQATAGNDAMAARCNAAVLKYVVEVHRRMLDTPFTSWSQNRWQVPARSHRTLLQALVTALTIVTAGVLITCRVARAGPHVRTHSGPHAGPRPRAYPRAPPNRTGSTSSTG